MKLDLEHVWRGLSSPVRRQVLDLLRAGPLTTGEVAGQFPDLTRYAIMQHLGVLEESDLLLVRREGRNRFNYLNPVPLRMIYERWVNEHADFAADTMLRIKRFAEQKQKVESEESMPGTDSALEAGRVVKIESEVAIAAPQEQVFRAITTELDAWWPHRFKPTGKMVIEPFAGGKCYEDWGDGAGAHHGFIVWWEPNTKFVATGPGVMYRGFECYDVQTVVPDSTGEGCIYRKSTTFWGAVPESVETMFRDGLKGLMEKYLKAYVMEGTGYVAGNSAS
jgi:DNA-binding transcriptional ArsR family regulator